MTSSGAADIFQMIPEIEGLYFVMVSFDKSFRSVNIWENEGQGHANHHPNEVIGHLEATYWL